MVDNLKTIATEVEYDAALRIAEALIANKNLSSDERASLHALVLLIEEYEEEHYPMPTVSPQAMLEHLMNASGLKQADLVGILGSKGVVSEVVNGRRSISKAQAKALAQFFHVSPALFI